MSECTVAGRGSAHLPSDCQQCSAEGETGRRGRAGRRLCTAASLSRPGSEHPWSWLLTHWPWRLPGLHSSSPYLLKTEKVKCFWPPGGRKTNFYKQDFSWQVTLLGHFIRYTDTICNANHYSSATFSTLYEAYNGQFLLKPSVRS